MKVSDYIVDYLIRYGVKNLFGYPGGMVTHLMDSLSKREKEIHTCLTYHEQGAAFAACGYAQASGGLGVAFATSGPGATNLLTGVCNSYFDSIPVLFITGQVNSYEGKMNKQVRQCGFQETDIVAMAKEVTKFAAYVSKAETIRYYLEQAIYEATNGRPGAVLLDIPMDVMRSEISPEKLKPFEIPAPEIIEKKAAQVIIDNLGKARRPVFLFGNGIKLAKATMCARRVAEKYNIPVVSSMIAVDVMGESENYYGFIGAYGNRTANFVVAKADLVICLGSRMDIRQVGKNRAAFAPDAQIIRVDIDNGELEYKVHEQELSFCEDVKEVLECLDTYHLNQRYEDWIKICQFIRSKLIFIDKTNSLDWMKKVFSNISGDAIICTDVGQNQVWAAQAASTGISNQILFSGSMGAMGYALPAAIGASLATGKETCIITGDGGLQMNLQELQVVARDHLPIKIVLFNNHALGMIRHFQEMYFDKNYYMTVSEGGYVNPSFNKIAEAYGISYQAMEKMEDLEKLGEKYEDPVFIEIFLNEDTYVFPKLEYGKPNQDQEPLIDRELYQLLMDDQAIIREIQEGKTEI